MGVAESRVRRRHPAAPGGRYPGASRLVPDDLAPHVEPYQRRLLDHVCVQRNVRLATQICDVDKSATPIDKDPVGFAHHVADQRHELVVRQVVVIILANVIWG